MAQNDFLVWAGGANANVLSQSAYAGATNLTSGVVAGKASGQQANKTWRQASVMAAVLAQFIIDRVGADVVDDGTTATIEANFIAAIRSLAVIPNTGVVPGTYGPTVSLTVEADGRITALQNANLQGTGLTPGTYVAPTISVGSDGRISSITSVAYGPLAGSNTWTATNTYQAGVTVNGFDNGGGSNGAQFRAISGSYGAMLRNDGTSVYLLQTASGQPTGVWNSFLPFSWNLASGVVSIDGTGAGTSFGGATVIPNSRFYASKDSGGTTRSMLGYSGDNWVEALAGQSGFRVLNNAGNTAEFTVDNAGNATATASVIGTSVQAINGNVTATNGRLRASLGARGSGDGSAATLLSDFSASFGATGYTELPNGLIIQWGTGVATTNGSGVFYAINFPNACLAGATCVIGFAGFNGNTIQVSAFASNGFSCWGNNVVSPLPPPGGVEFTYIVVGF